MSKTQLLLLRERALGSGRRRGNSHDIPELYEPKPHGWRCQRLRGITSRLARPFLVIIASRVAWTLSGKAWQAHGRYRCTQGWQGRFFSVAGRRMHSQSAGSPASRSGEGQMEREQLKWKEIVPSPICSKDQNYAVSRLRAICTMQGELTLGQRRVSVCGFFFQFVASQFSGTFVKVGPHAAPRLNFPVRSLFPCSPFLFRFFNKIFYFILFVQCPESEIRVLDLIDPMRPISQQVKNLEQGQRGTTVSCCKNPSLAHRALFRAIARLPEPELPWKLHSSGCLCPALPSAPRISGQDLTGIDRQQANHYLPSSTVECQ